MQRYRVFFLSSYGGRVNQQDMDCRDDDDAIDRVGRSDHPMEMELWQADRLVAQFGAIGARRAWRLGR